MTDRRTYKDRRDVWAEEKKAAELVTERPKAKIRHNTPPPEENPLRKNKGGASEAKSQDAGDEDLVSVINSTLLSGSNWICFLSSLSHPLRRKRQLKRRPPLPKKSNKRRRKKKNRSVASKIIAPSPHFSLSFLSILYPYLSAAT